MPLYAASHIFEQHTHIVCSAIPVNRQSPQACIEASFVYTQHPVGVIFRNPIGIRGNGIPAFLNFSH